MWSDCFSDQDGFALLECGYLIVFSDQNGFALLECGRLIVLLMKKGLHCLNVVV